MAASSLLFAIEAVLKLPVLSLSPVLGLISGMVFLAKAGVLSGVFYIQAVTLFATFALAARSQEGVARLAAMDKPNEARLARGSVMAGAPVAVWV